MAQSKDMTIGQLAVCWALCPQEVTSAIVGTRKRGQITETVQACEKSLSEEDKSLIMNHIIKFESQLSHGRR